MQTRREIAAMNDTALRIAYDGVASRISEDWRRGAPGRLSDVSALALMRLEAEIRDLPLSPVNSSRQLSLL